MTMINGKTRTCGLIGNPVEHTMSPLIHNFLAKELGINMVYVPFHVEKGLLRDAVKGAYGLHILGCNVTVPYKSEVMESLASVDELAQKIGSVNTLVRMDGGYKGYNTDITGLLRALTSEGITLGGEEMIVLGAGGVGRAVAFMCAANGASKVYLLNRTLEKAAAVADEVNKKLNTSCVEAWRMEDYDKLPDKKYFVIQATSVGLYPQVDDVVIEDEDFYKKVKAGYDLIYTPWETKFMKLVKAHGAKAYNGLKMLLFQAVDAFELWNDCKVPEEITRRAYELLQRTVAERKNILLVGYMGCGKTSVGKYLAKITGMTFADTDEMIEKQQGRSIREIFASEGEEAFRDMETRLLEELLETGREGMVIATGGGMPLREENRTLLKRLGSVYYLKAEPRTIYTRVKDDTTRPLLQCEDPFGRICEMISVRGPLYEEASHHTVLTGRGRLQELAQKIKAIGKEEGIL